VLIRPAAHQDLASASSLVSVLNVCREAIASDMTQVERTVCIGPCHEN